MTTLGVRRIYALNCTCLHPQHEGTNAQVCYISKLFFKLSWTAHALHNNGDSKVVSASQDIFTGSYPQLVFGTFWSQARQGGPPRCCLCHGGMHAETRQPRARHCHGCQRSHTPPACGPLCSHWIAAALSRTHQYCQAAGCSATSPVSPLHAKSFSYSCLRAWCSACNACYGALTRIRASCHTSAGMQRAPDVIIKSAAFRCMPACVGERRVGATAEEAPRSGPDASSPNLAPDRPLRLDPDTPMWGSYELPSVCDTSKL